ncbi:asparagine synthase (glutamine-hydrolyzing) [Desulfovibrio sp. OttesenSCG-928-G11]|nr:asparagine synthase (glutamine-hydrolyzing) [Desulfovibrio sp. OttesenSCG-928-G11]
MCGLAGILSKTGVRVDPAPLKAMCDIQAHRGPDDAGYVFFRPGRLNSRGHYSRFVDPAFHGKNQHLAPFGGPYFEDQCHKLQFLLGMGHRRLSIIDLSVSGHQPMASPDRRYWLTFNGEAYNFPELRNMLRDRGHEFYSLSDTEVILHMWEEFGLDCLAMFDGMFALAVYDMHENTLTLARDRFGIKPLYYAQNADMFVYASEVKGILASGCIKGELDPGALREYFTFQNIYSSRTLVKDIFLLGPSEVMTIRPGSGEGPRFHKFHHGFPAVDPRLTDEKALEEAISESFASAVKRQLISDVDVGAYLSGGMDSGSIVAVAGRSIPRLHTFTCGFDLTNVSGIEQGFDERANSERLAYLLQTEHYEVVLHSGDMPAAMEKITWHVDDPRVGMCHQNWYAAKLASKFVKVCLGGAGGDELFAGYPWRYLNAMSADDSIDTCREKAFEYWHRLLPPDRLDTLFVPELEHSAQHARQVFEEAFNRAPEADRELPFVENALQRMLHFEFRTFLQGVLLIEDKISMAHSLEVRVPFLDNALADLAFRIPTAHKLNIAKMAGHVGQPLFKADEGKLILRKAMRRFLPELYTQQPKQGFSPPDGNWYRGESMDYIKEVLYDSRTRERPWFNQKTVTACLEEHFSGRQNHRLLIWSLLSVEWLQRHFCDTRLSARQKS